MDIYLICVIILTTIFSIVGIYLIFVLRSVNKTINNMDHSIDQLKDTAVKAEKALGEAEETFALVNNQLPPILAELGHAASNVRSVTKTLDTQLREEDEYHNHTLKPSIASAANFGNVVLKGYSVWKKLKRNRFPV